MLDDDGDRTERGWRVSGSYARYRGVTYAAGSHSQGRDGYAFLRITQDAASRFSEVLDGEPLRAKVRLRDLDGFVRVNLIGRFAGHEVQVMSMEPRRTCFVAMWGGQLGRLHGLEGDQYGGFEECRPPDEVEIVREEVFDILRAETRRPSTGL